MTGLERKGILFLAGKGIRNDQSRNIMQRQWQVDVGINRDTKESRQRFDSDLERLILEEQLEEDQLDLPQVEVSLVPADAGHGPRIMGLTVQPHSDSRKKWQFNKIVLGIPPGDHVNDS